MNAPFRDRRTRPGAERSKRLGLVLDALRPRCRARLRTRPAWHPHSTRSLQAWRGPIPGAVNVTSERRDCDTSPDLHPHAQVPDKHATQHTHSGEAARPASYGIDPALCRDDGCYPRLVPRVVNHVHSSPGLQPELDGSPRSRRTIGVDLILDACRGPPARVETEPDRGAALQAVRLAQHWSERASEAPSSPRTNGEGGRDHRSHHHPAGLRGREPR